MFFADQFFCGFYFYFHAFFGVPLLGAGVSALLSGTGRPHTRGSTRELAAGGEDRSLQQKMVQQKHASDRTNDR
jgi:hypothetical protein